MLKLQSFTWKRAENETHALRLMRKQDGIRLKRIAAKSVKVGKIIQRYDTSVAVLPVFALSCIIYVVCAVSAADSDNT